MVTHNYSSPHIKDTSRIFYDDTLESFQVCQYNSQGKPFELITFSSSLTMRDSTIFSYDLKGNLIKETLCYANSSCIMRTNEFNSMDLLVRSFSTAETIDSYYSYYYDSVGNLITESICSGVSCRILVRYEYKVIDSNLAKKYNTAACKIFDIESDRYYITATNIQALSMTDWQDSPSVFCLEPVMHDLTFSRYYR
jgi:hypothetical protein